MGGPATSAPCERVFSTAGRVLEKRRASLKPEALASIVLVHENLQWLDEMPLDELIFDD